MSETTFPDIQGVAPESRAVREDHALGIRCQIHLGEDPVGDPVHVRGGALGDVRRAPKKSSPSRSETVLSSLAGQRGYAAPRN
jgi:hypothetical protein